MNKRKILLAVSGMSPQIVTETLYALVTRDTPWIPDEIHLLSTKDGCERAKVELLHPSRAIFQRFCEEYLPQGHQIRFDSECLHTFTHDGKELSDIHNLDDSAHVADEIAKKVFEFTRDNETEIHASIAGGRKTMGFLLGYAMSLYGRVQDRLSHVLVTEGFEGNPDFYYPPKTPTVIYDRNKKPLDTSKAEVMLAEIPILHLGHVLPSSYKNTPASFSDLVQIMNKQFSAPTIEINMQEKTLTCHGIEVKMSPAPLALYSLIAYKTKKQGGMVLSDITEQEFAMVCDFIDNPKGFSFNPDQYGGNGRILAAQHQKKYKALLKNLEEKGNESVAFFDDKKTKIKKQLNAELGMLADRYLLKKDGNKTFIDILPENIHLVNVSKKDKKNKSVDD